MIRPSTLLPILDNSGALQIGCISVAKADKRKGATAASLITASVKVNIFKKNIKKKSRILNKSQVVKAIVLTVSKEIKRKGNFYIKSAPNSAVILNQYELPYGTRLFGPVFREVRKRTRFRKVVSLATSLI